MESHTLRTDYYIRNVTGMPLFFSLTGKERRLLHNKKQAILMSTVADDVTGTFVRIGGVRPRQNLSIQVEGFERVDNIDLGNTGKVWTFLQYKLILQMFFTCHNWHFGLSSLSMLVSTKRLSTKSSISVARRWLSSRPLYCCRIRQRSHWKLLFPWTKKNTDL